MREDGLQLVEDGDKYYELIDLYNAWYKLTCFLSVGNTNVPEWDALVEYCKDNKMETAHFYCDLISAYIESEKQGIRTDHFVGFFNEIIHICFNDDKDFPKFDGYVDGRFVQACYYSYIEWYLEGKPELNLWDKIKNKITTFRNSF